jgi:hypothetical protein
MSIKDMVKGIFLSIWVLLEGGYSTVNAGKKNDEGAP